MTFTQKLREIQNELAFQEIDGWLLYDFRRSNPLAHKVLEIPQSYMTSRRFFYWIPQKGEPIKILPLIEPYTLDHLPGDKWIYRSWKELDKFLLTISVSHQKIAMEYSPNNALPVLSKVDAGTVESVRKGGSTVVSSANILQRYTSVWSQQQLESHLYAAETLDKIIDQTWKYIEQTLQQGQPLDEYTVQQFMLNKIHEKGCTTYSPPICAVNFNSADPHYTPSAEKSLPVVKNDFILLDAWCKKDEPHAVYADIARVGVAAPLATDRQLEIFQLIKRARDETTEFIRARYEQNFPIQAWEADQFCRNIIEQAGYGQYFIHRTGHNIGEEVHGEGANLDNLETHDFRLLIPGTCFSIEPGIYIPGEFGIRLEYDVYLTQSNKIEITGGVQESLVCLNI